MSISYAQAQIRDFHYIKDNYLNKVQLNESVDYRDYIESLRNYYPSGSRQQKGTHLDWIVELCRQNVIDDIRCHAETDTTCNIEETPNVRNTR